MRKRLAIIALVFVMLFSLAACSGGKSSIVGKWSLDSFEYEGETHDKKDLILFVSGVNGDDLTFTVEFNKDNSVAVNMFGEEQTGTWEDNGDGTYNVVIDGSAEVFTLDGDTLTMGENPKFIFK